MTPHECRKEWFDLMIRLSRQAGEMAMRSFRNAAVEVKKSSDGRDLVTEADREIEAYLTREILGAFPRHGVMGEENGLVRPHADPEPVLWVIDPIDGTFNYAAGVPLFGTSIGICVNGSSVAGAIEMPALGETFSAVRGEGAFLNGERIHVDDSATLETALVDCCGRDLFSLFRRLGDIRTDRRLPRLTGCAVLSIAYVAAGRFGAMIHTSLNPWDVAAGLVLIEEAGGRFTDFAGLPLFPRFLDLFAEGAGDKFCCVAAPPALHGRLREILPGVSVQALGGA